MKYRVGVSFKIIEENGNLVPKVIERYPVPKDYAEKNGIPHEVVFCLAVSSEGKILRIKRSYEDNTYPGYNSIPAGHSNIIEKNDELICESPLQAAERELWEETKLKARKYKQILEDALIYDAPKGHYGVVIACLVDKGEPKFSPEEIVPSESGFQAPEEIISMFEAGEKFTPPSQEVLKNFFQKMETQDRLKDFYESLIY